MTTSSKRQSFKEWYNEIIVTRKKHFIRGVVLAIVVIVGVQVQIGRTRAAQDAENNYNQAYRTWQVAEAQYEQCVGRVNGIMNLRDVIAHLIDMTPERQAYIDAHFPEPPANMCPPEAPKPPKAP